MLDSLSIKPLIVANVPGTAYNTARPFEKVEATVKGRETRSNYAVGALNPSRLEIAHTAPTSDKAKQQSLLALHQTRSRVDVSGNVLKQDVSETRVSVSRSSTVTEAELVEDFALLVGALAENNYALFRAFVRMEK